MRTSLPGSERGGRPAAGAARSLFEPRRWSSTYEGGFWLLGVEGACGPASALERNEFGCDIFFFFLCFFFFFFFERKGFLQKKSGGMRKGGDKGANDFEKVIMMKEEKKKGRPKMIQRFFLTKKNTLMDIERKKQRGERVFLFGDFVFFFFTLCRLVVILVFVVF